MSIGVDWSYYDKFTEDEQYLPKRGEGETLATQLVTALTKLIRKWYNDGDVYDNTHYLEGWWNDLSDYANWIYKHYKESRKILDRIKTAYSDSDYEDILKELADRFFVGEFLAEENKKPKDGSIYECKGKFKYKEH